MRYEIAVLRKNDQAVTRCWAPASSAIVGRKHGIGKFYVADTEKRGKPGACIDLPPQKIPIISHAAAEQMRRLRGGGAASIALKGECAVHLQDFAKFADRDHACQICGAKLRISEVEPHPKRGEWEIHGFSCRNCGPVKSLVVKRLH